MWQVGLSYFSANVKNVFKNANLLNMKIKRWIFVTYAYFLFFDRGVGMLCCSY